jgi:hypothetical protein
MSLGDLLSLFAKFEYIHRRTLDPAAIRATLKMSRSVEDRQSNDFPLILPKRLYSLDIPSALDKHWLRLQALPWSARAGTQCRASREKHIPQYFSFQSICYF